MTTDAVLVATRPPLNLPWQLAAPDGHLPFLLIGWHVPAADKDGGVPKQIAGILAAALLHVGKITYLRSSAPPSSQNARSRLFKPRGVGERLSAAFNRSPREFWTVTTDVPEIATELFDDPGFPWSLQGQLGLVSGRESYSIPDREILLAIADPAAPLTREDLAALDAVAVLRPGVDGDVAGIVSSSPTVEAAILEAIQTAASNAHVSWRILDEDAFASSLSEIGHSQDRESS